MNQKRIESSVLGLWAAAILVVLAALPASAVGTHSTGPGSILATTSMTPSFSPGALSTDRISAAADYARRFSGTPGDFSGGSLAGVAGETLRQSSLTFEEMPTRAPGVAFLMSALVPGTGQLYNGNSRGFLFLGIEVASWFARTSYVDAGNSKEGEMETFGRRHWSYDLYTDTRGSDGCLWTADSDSLILHNMENDQDQFYEDIGREEFYRCGWDDFDDNFNPDDPSNKSPHRDSYEGMRTKTNDLRSNARLAVGIMVVNRIVSAVDAFRTARSRREGQTAAHSFRVESRLDGTIQSPRAVVQLVKEWP